jgi:nucleotide-binding universal stress UspA family protein
VDPREAPGSRSARHAVDGPALMVVGVDGSATAWRAFAWACGHARRAGCTLLCVYVSRCGFWDALVPMSQAALLRDTGAQCAAEIRAELTEAARAFGVPVRFEHRFGDPAQELVRVAHDRGADLVVVGASAHVLHRVAGSLPGRLARSRHVPVVVVP